MSNARLKQLMKDNNIKPLKLPPTPKPTILTGKEDPRLPKQIFQRAKRQRRHCRNCRFPVHA